MGIRGEGSSLILIKSRTMELNKTLEDKGKLLTNMLPLLSFGKQVVIKTLGDVIFRLFFNGSTVGHTYVPAENWKVQITGTKRTIEDCFLIAKTYFPEISYTLVNDAVVSLYDVKAEVQAGYSRLPTPVSILTRGYCGDVQRNVHSAYAAKFGKTQSIEYINELLNNKNLNYGDIDSTTEAGNILKKEEIVL